MILDDIDRLIQITEARAAFEMPDDVMRGIVSGARWVGDKLHGSGESIKNFFRYGMAGPPANAGAEKVGAAIGTLANTPIGKGVKWGIGGGLGLAGLGILGGAYKAGSAMAPGPYPVNNAIPSGIPTLIGGAALGAAGAYGLHRYHKNKTKNEI